jgi:N-acetyl-alpha-D-muramate 1-phosphate uridylyltransferase
MLPVAVLCGGLGTRLYPVTKTVPKALVQVGEQPFIAHQLRLLHHVGVRRVVLCVGYLGEAIETFAGDGSAFGIEIGYAHDGPVPLGTGGAVRKAIPMLGDAFFTMYGDSYLPGDYGAVEEAFVRSGKLGLMTIWRNAGELAPSNVDVRNGIIVRYDKKAGPGTMHYIDWGLSAFHARAFDRFDGSAAFDLGDVHRALLGERQLASYEVHERFYEVGSPDGIVQTGRFLG